MIFHTHSSNPSTHPLFSHSHFPNISPNPRTNLSTQISKILHNPSTLLPNSTTLLPIRSVGKKSWMKNHGGLGSIKCELGLGDGTNNVVDDGFYMRRCVELARKAVGCTSPNPMVGCVIVKDGKIVGEGFHPKAGQPHAEVFALRDAGDLAENGTVYVSLEPCNHYGRTPPCSEALIKAKVKRVVVGMIDPNPLVASRGVDRLQDAGIEVTVGVEEEMCKKLNEAFIHKMLTGNPFVTLRYSLSVNGHVSNDLGEEAMESGGYYSRLLQEYDAVILSYTSVQKYTRPLSEEPEAKQPLQIVIAKNLNSSFQIPLLATESTSNVIIFTDRETDIKPETAQQGIESVVLDKVNLTAILDHCKSQGMNRVLLDLRGGVGDFEEIITEGFEQNLLQKFVVEVLPVWSKGKQEYCPEVKSLGQRLKLKKLTPRISGKSVLLEGYF